MPDICAQTTISRQLNLASVDPDTSYYLGDWVLHSTIKIMLNGDNLSSTYWNFDEQYGLLSFEESIQQLLPITSEFVVNYEVYPFTIARQYQPRKPLEIDSSFFEYPDSLQNQISALPSDQSFSDVNLQQSGSLSRGIIIGSNQDFSLESGLNFELNGALTENININASLTDKSIPIQPEGTTQNLREFDKVLIQLEAPNGNIQMGDVDISLEQSTFAKLNRRLQGASGSVNSNFGNYEGALSVVRGSYKSIQFNGQEGVQGPYRLTGRNGEEFIMVLAGTERVYVNGVRMQRGAENDYIIDYGLGEVSFTNNVLVKDETRIVIEYEYTDQNFNRTMMGSSGNGEFLNGKFTIGATVIRQADGDDLLSQQNLTRDDIDKLREVGDNLKEARVSGVRLATEQEREENVLYAEIDTVLNGQQYTIYKHLPGSPEAIYRVQFTNVGENQGSYRRTGGQVNGLLYEWVGPQQGNYEPFRQLPAPQKHQMVAFDGQYNISDQFTVFGEWAASDFDENRFSDLDNDDNTDIAYETGLQARDLESPLGKIDARIYRRYSGKQFQFFERTRDVEFDRKWNISRTGQSKEEINEASVSVRPTTATQLNSELGFIEREQFSGLRQAASVSSNENNFIQVNYVQDWVNTEDKILQLDGNWFRQQGTLRYQWEAGNTVFSPYLSIEHENQIQRNTLTDSLTQASESFYDVAPGLNINFGNLELDASIGYRSEKEVFNNKLTDEASAIEQRYQLRYRHSNFETVNVVRWREKKYTDVFASQGRADRQSLLLKSVTSYRSNNDFVDGELYYQVNTQRQALLQETYIEVGPETGQYIWDDINEDGVQQVDEFFPEIGANEGTFVRQFLPSDDLFPVIDLNLRLLHTFQPFKMIQNGNQDHWVNSIAFKSRFDIRENSTTENLSDIYFLNFSTFRNDDFTIQGRLQWEKEIDLLRGLQVADVSIGYNENHFINQRSTEQIQNYFNQYYLNTSYNATDRILILLDSNTGIQRKKSSALFSRNYNIKSYSISPAINATISRNWNSGLNVSFIQKEDRYPVQKVRANILKIGLTQRTYFLKKIQSNMLVELRHTTLNGVSSTYGSFELTEGMGEGTNLIWSINASYRTNNFVRLSFTYDGRTVTGRPSVHTIKLVLSASF